MFRIVKKLSLNPSVTRMDIVAPRVARKAKAGQFIILRIDETGERIPLTIADANPNVGTVTVIYQKVGCSTLRLDMLAEGDSLLDFVGPLGRETDIGSVKRVAVIGGGVGCAIAYPEAKAFYHTGAYVDMVAGFRTKNLIILESEFAAVSHRLIVMTDDGSNGRKGFVTDALKALLEESISCTDKQYDAIVTIGPLPMMRAVANLTEPYGIHTVASMNPIMIDGTGMCGCCRLSVGGEMKFACVDGPEFDAHKIDWDEAIQRLGQYREEEHGCRLREQGEH